MHEEAERAEKDIMVLKVQEMETQRETLEGEISGLKTEQAKSEKTVKKAKKEIVSLK